MRTLTLSDDLVATFEAALAREVARSQEQLDTNRAVAAAHPDGQYGFAGRIPFWTECLAKDQRRLEEFLRAKKRARRRAE